MAIIIGILQDDNGFPASRVLESCGHLLQDTDHERWTVDELLGWTAEAVKAIGNMNPAATQQETVITLTEGARQTLPKESSQLFDLVCNLSSSGANGRAITRTDRSVLDLTFPEWPQLKTRDQVRQFMFDDRAPGLFYVYPPVNAGTKVRASLSVIPLAITSADDYVPVRPEFEPALINYVMYRASSKDSEFANGAVAVGYYQAYQTEMGVEGEAANVTTPNKAQV